MKTIEGYTIGEKIGEGGNAYVYKAIKNGESKEVALKILKYKYKEKIIRFIDEIKIVKENQEKIKNIIPIIDDSISEQYYYTMPIAENILERLSNRTIKEKMEAMLELSIALKELHNLGIIHRDIKPSNLYYYNGYFCFSDFGLVDYEGKEKITTTDEIIGARATIAPEMLRDSKKSDPKLADIYSLVKTFWMILNNKNKYSFYGEYNSNIQSHNIEECIHEYIPEIEEILNRGTKDNPKERCDLDFIIEKLSQFLKNYRDFNHHNITQWEYINSLIDGEMIVWNKRIDIVNKLRNISKINLTHVLLPGGGGLDLNNAQIYWEDNCIKLRLQYSDYVMSPENLKIIKIDGSSYWSYYIMNLKEIKPVFNKFVSDEYHEEVESYNNKYISTEYYPDGEKSVTRILKGRLLFVNKRSTYNLKFDTYDARHNRMSEEQLEKYMKKLKDLYQNIEEK